MQYNLKTPCTFWIQKDILICYVCKYSNQSISTLAFFQIIKFLGNSVLVTWQARCLAVDPTGHILTNCDLTKNMIGSKKWSNLSYKKTASRPVKPPKLNFHKTRLSWNTTTVWRSKVNRAPCNERCCNLQSALHNDHRWIMHNKDRCHIAQLHTERCWLNYLFAACK